MNQANINVDKTISKINTAIAELKVGIQTAELKEDEKVDIIRDLEEVIALAEGMKG